jgi:hypothetical protein
MKKPLYCSIHKLKDMIYIGKKKCAFDNCTKTPSFNLIGLKPLFCFNHKLDDMIDLTHKKCIHLNCTKRPNYNYSNISTPIYCLEHKKPDMIIVKKKAFSYCSITNCNNNYTFVINGDKFCDNHIPNDILIKLKKICKFCDIEPNSDYICTNCNQIKNKKEFFVVRYLKKHIKHESIYNSSSMLQGCSKKRPDLFYDLLSHCIIVEIDEHQHKSYNDSCECSRINEIANAIGGKSVIIIRFNPDNIKHHGITLDIPLNNRLISLVQIINTELLQQYDTFIVKLIQLYFDDDFDQYKTIKEENITNLVCI